MEYMSDTAWLCSTHGGVRKDLCCADAIPFTPADFHFASVLPVDATRGVPDVIDFADELRCIANEFDTNEYGVHWRVNRDIANAAANEIDRLREIVEGPPPAAPIVIAYPEETRNGVTLHASESAAASPVVDASEQLKDSQLDEKASTAAAASVTLSDIATNRARRDWRYSHERVVSDENARDVDTLTSKTAIAIQRVRSTLDMAKKGSAGCWLENETLLAMRFVVESLVVARASTPDKPIECSSSAAILTPLDNSNELIRLRSALQEAQTAMQQIRAACDTAMRLDVPTRELVGRIRATLPAAPSSAENSTP